MCKARFAMATTNFVEVREREKGFDGRGIVEGTRVVSEVWWMWIVESQDAEMRILWLEL